MPSTTAPSHSLLDDAQAFTTATVFIALGLALLAAAGLVTGGAPGLALLLRHATGLPLGWALFLVNLPFYALAMRALGWRFTAKTLLAVSALSLAVEGVGRAVALQFVHPLFAAVAGGLLIGAGLLVLFRHQASLGGVGVLALHLHRRWGWSTGTVQLALDAAILLASLAVIEPQRLAYSVLASLMVNLVLVWNHRPGRYVAE